MKPARLASAVAVAAFLAGTAAFATATPLPAGITAVPLAVVTNDRDATVSRLQLMVDAQDTVRGIYLDTSATADSQPSAESARVYPLAKIETDKGVVLGQGQGVKAIFLRGNIASQAGQGSLVIRYLTNGIFRHYAECKIDLHRVGPDHWQLVNAYDGQPIDQMRVKTWALGISTIANVCPNTSLG